MARPTANVVISTDSFASWVGITNFMADTFTNYALTANNSAIGANVSGNSQLWGTFAANTVGAGTELRGGTVSTSANLNITSNAIFTGATINATSNVNLVASNTYINSVVTYVVGGAANLTSNVSITNANTNINATSFGVQGNTVITGNTTIRANSSLSNFIITTGVSLSNITMSANLTTVAGNVNFNTGTFFVDSVNGRLGIKNTTPDASLTITGTANVSANVWMGNTLYVPNANIGTVNAVTLNVSGVTGLGNTTITGFANVTTTGTFGGVVNAASFNATSTTATSTFANNVTVQGTVTATTFAISGGGAFSVNNLTVTGNTTFGSVAVFQPVVNTNLGTTTASPVEVFNFPLTYFGARITARIGTYAGAVQTQAQTQDLIIAQNATDVVLTSYGTVASPATANLGVFSASINSTAVSVKFQQTGANSTVRLLTQLLT